jgi:hypothetical protein
MTLAVKRFPVTDPSYPASGITFTIDKTGTIYQSYMGDCSKTAPFGLRVFRCKPGNKPEELFYTNGGGWLVVINKKLYIGYTDSNWQSWYGEIPGYIDPSDTPSSQVVNVNEAAMAVYKQQVDLAQKTANQSIYTANAASSAVGDLKQRVAKLEATVVSLQSQITQLQAQQLTPQQVQDVVWSKIWDVNYLIRLGFVNGSSPDPQVQAYITDDATFVKNVVGK